MNVPGLCNDLDMTPRPRLHGTGFTLSRHRVGVVCGHIYTLAIFSMTTC